MANEERRLKAGFHGRKDPIQGALREQSTHYEAGTRITVYERLGLNKPGFWADHQKRKEQEEVDESYEAPTPQWRPPMMEYQSQDVKYTKEKTSRITLHKMNLEDSPVGGGTGKGSAALTRQFKNQLNSVVANNWKSLTKAHPWMDMSSSNMLAAEKIGTSYALAQAFGAALQKDPHAMLNKVATEYYFNKANAAAVARDNVPFGHGLPTQFEQMQAALTKTKKEVKGNTGGEGIQEKQQKQVKQTNNMATQTLTAQNTNRKVKANLNVHKNSYASNYLTPNIFS